MIPRDPHQFVAWARGLAGHFRDRADLIEKIADIVAANPTTESADAAAGMLYEHLIGQLTGVTPDPSEAKEHADMVSVLTRIRNKLPGVQ